MKQLLLHPSTQNQLESLLRGQPHAVIISGARGSGKKTLALHIATTLINITDIAKHPYFMQIAPTNNSIGIDDVRRVKAFLGKKTTGRNDIRRIVLVGDAHTMTIEAQNALLKVLEEPPTDTMLLLTVSDLSALKPTIVSRAQHMIVMPITKIAALQILRNQGYTDGVISTAFNMSRGQVGLLMALINQVGDHEIVSAISTAKEFLRLSTYERLLRVDELSKQKQHLGLFIDGLQRVVASGLEQAALKNNKPQVVKFHSLSTRLQSAQDALSNSANTKLLLCNLLLQL